MENRTGSQLWFQAGRIKVFDETDASEASGRMSCKMRVVYRHK